MSPKSVKLIGLRLLVLLLVAAVSATAEAAEPATSSSPNVVLIVVDDLGQRDLSCYGSDFYETPNMDSLAADGVRFERAYAAYPRCVSSRTGLLSGKFPCRVEYQARKSKSPHHLPLEEVTFGEAFQQQGYQTCYLGKWHLGKSGGGPGQQGFGTVIHSGSAGATGSYFHPFTVEKGNHVDNPVDGVEGDYLNDRLTDEAVQYIKNAGSEKPFLMVMAHYAVHTPLETTEDKKKKYQKKLRKAGLVVGGKRQDEDLVADRQGFSKTKQNNPIYAGMVESTDESVGRILDAIQQSGIKNNTIVILTSDHGGLSTRGVDNRRPLATSNAPLRQGKGSIFEGGIRVPLIVSWPGKIAPSVSPTQITGTDIYPTMLELAGLRLLPEQHTDGLSFKSTLLQEDANTESITDNASVRPLFWYKWMARPDSTGDTRALALIEGDFKLIYWFDEDLVELFNLTDDPGEQTNLAEQHADRVDAMMAKIEQIEMSVGNQRAEGQKMLNKREERLLNRAKKNRTKKKSPAAKENS